MTEPSLQEWKEAEERLQASLESDHATVEKLRLLTMQHSALQHSLARKDTLINSLEAQVADMTRALAAQSSLHAQWDRMQRESLERVEQRERDVIDLASRNEWLQQALDQARSELDNERTLHVQARQSYEGQLRAAEQQHRQREKSVNDLQSQLRSREESSRKSSKTMAELEAQVATLRTQIEQQDKQRMKAEMAVRDATERLNQERNEHDGTTRKLQEANQTIEKQKRESDDLHREFSALKRDYISARSALEAIPTLQTDLQQARKREQDAQQRFVEMKTKSQTSEAALAAAEQTMSHQTQQISRLHDVQAHLHKAQSDLLAKDMALARLQTELSQSQHDLAQARTSLDGLQQQLSQSRDRVSQLEDETLPTLHKQLEEARKGEKEARQPAEARGRIIRTQVEQLKQLLQRHPTIAATAATHNSSSPSKKPSSSTNLTSQSSSASLSDSDISELRDEFSACIFELNTCLRSASTALQESHSRATQLQEQAEAQRKLVQQLQNEAEGAARSQAKRNREMETALFKAQQELVCVRSDAAEASSEAAAARAQTAKLWSCCAILCRSVAPLRARLTDLITQKQWMQHQLESFIPVQQQVALLRQALQRDTQRVESTLADSSHSTASIHPYRLHTPRILSLRSAVLGVLAARRFWHLRGETRYGCWVQVGQQSGVLLAMEDADGDIGDIDGTNMPAQAHPTPSRQSTLQGEGASSLPFIDTTTPVRTAASLMRLLEHFVSGSSSAAPLAHPSHMPSSYSYSSWLQQFDSFQCNKLSEPTLLQRIVAAKRILIENKRRQMMQPSRPDVSLSTYPNTMSDLTFISSAVSRLAARASQLESAWSSAQHECVLLVQASTRMQERMHAEQARAQEMIRREATLAREHEERAQSLTGEIDDLRRAMEKQRSQMVSRTEFDEMIETSEQVLHKFKLLESDHETLKSQFEATRKAAEKHSRALVERDSTILKLRRRIEDLQLQLESCRSSDSEFALLQSQLEQTQQRLVEAERDAADARKQLSHAHASLGHFDSERRELETRLAQQSRELFRCREVLHGISQAHQFAEAATATATPSHANINTCLRTPMHHHSSTTSPSGMQLRPPSASSSFAASTSSAPVGLYAADDSGETPLHSSQPRTSVSPPSTVPGSRSVPSSKTRDQRDHPDFYCGAQ